MIFRRQFHDTSTGQLLLVTFDAQSGEMYVGTMDSAEPWNGFGPPLPEVLEARQDDPPGPDGREHRAMDIDERLDAMQAVLERVAAAIGGPAVEQHHPDEMVAPEP